LKSDGLFSLRFSLSLFLFILLLVTRLCSSPRLLRHTKITCTNMSSESPPVFSVPCNLDALINNTAEINEIPNRISYFAIPGVNTSDPWMETCCGASTVHLSDVCWLWCEMDPAIVSSTPLKDDLGSDFSKCLIANGRDPSIGTGTLTHYNPPPRSQPGESEVQFQPSESQVQSQPSESQAQPPPTESETQSQPNESQTQPQPTESQPSAAQDQRPLLLRSVLGALVTSMVVAVISTA
jgi:hypothetical protein